MSQILPLVLYKLDVKEGFIFERLLSIKIKMRLGEGYSGEMYIIGM